MKVNGSIGLVGDYGNPDGSGYAKMALYGLEDTARTTNLTRLTAFHAALVTGQLTGTNIGESAVNYGDEAFSGKPAADINIDRKLVCRWRTTTDSSVKRITISGVPVGGTGTELVDAGERITLAGKGALEAALEAAYNLTADTCIVLSGIVLQPK